MAHTPRSPQRRSPSSSLSSPPAARKKYSLRRPTTRASSHALRPSASPPPDYRPVLVPLHPNLRRLPFRHSACKDSDKDLVMRDSDQVVKVGVKRKRVAGTNENALATAPQTRGSSRRKRMRTVVMTNRFVGYSSDETDVEMDAASNLSSGTAESVDETEGESGTDEEDDQDEDEDESSTDDYLLRFASTKTLARLRKPDLVRLYSLAGLPDDAELLTKHEIIDCLIGAREDQASLPPSSPVPRGDGSSSGSLSDDGNVAGGEETDAIPSQFACGAGMTRRRVTMQDFGKVNGRLPKGRSVSMGNLANHDAVNLGHKHSKKSSTETRERKLTSKRSSTRSPTSTLPSTSTNLSPPVTRLRTRKVSASTSLPSIASSSTASKSGKAKGKSKQVEFNDKVNIKLQTPSKRWLRGRARKREREREASTKLSDKESDLTDVDELERSIRLAQDGFGQPQLSPRRLRSKDRISGGKGAKLASAGKKEISSGQQRKATIPARQSKRRPEILEKDEQEEDTEERDQLFDSEELEEESEGEEEGEGGEQEGEYDEDECEEEAEIDELVSSTSATPPRSIGRRTPLRKRLRPRTRNGSAAPDDGDIEDEGEEDEDEDEDEEGNGGSQEDEEGQDNEGEKEADGEDDVSEHEDDGTSAVTPRKLRSGRVVGEGEDVEMETAEEDIGEEDSETGEEEAEADEGEGEDGDGEGEDEGEGEGEEDVEEEEDTEEAEEDIEVNTASDIEVDAEGETDGEHVMEEEVDLTVATAKTLVRLRRDDLVRLCETRDLEPVGTKPQLAEALLQWRDRHAGDRSSPSSTGTIRPPSTNKGRNKASSSASPIPVLLRSKHAHTDEPRTPIPDQEKEVDQDLELDLESLGLEDREIPPEKLAKLEKIGSGGFKDVFIGKFKGRRVAISEFRDTLSAMDIKELKLLGAFDHPNIVRFLGVSIPENTKETPVMIVSELCSNGDLYDYIRNVNTPSLHKVLSMMLDIARGLEYLHTRKPSIIHRDCKSSNILITARGTAKIADFGLAKVKQSTRSMVKSLVGTVNWQAPELWSAHPKYNHKVDVFSCALVFWEMLQWHLSVRKHPWEGMNEHGIYDIVGAKRQRPNVSGLRKQWCPEIIDLMERMWAHEHQDRPTMTEVVQELQELLARY